MSSTDEVIAKARETLDRTSMQYQVGPGRRARENDVGKRLTRAAVADLAIIGVAVTLGLVVGPIGIMGFFLMIVAMVVATAVLLVTPATATPSFERLRQTDLKALPSQTGRWLDAQRPALPAPAISVIDQIGLKLDALTPQLATLDDDEPAAAEIRKLVGEQLPEFIKGYERVPAALRGGRAQRQDARSATRRWPRCDRARDRRDGPATRAGRSGRAIDARAVSGDQVPRGWGGMIAPVLAAFVVALPPPATQICWLSDVRRLDAGVVIEFVDGPRSVWRKRAAMSERFEVDPATRDVTRDTAGVWQVKAVVAQIGDVLSVSNSPEDVCQLTVTKQGDAIGVIAEASFRLPNMPADTRTEFVSAR